VTATVIMGLGILRLQVHPQYDPSSFFELCCFLVASTLLAIPLRWLWKSRRENPRLVALVWVVVLQECVCIDEFIGLVREALNI
jgi:hypothetical protein